MVRAACFCFFFFFQVNSSNSDNSFLCVAIRQHVLPYDESKLSFEVALLYFNVLKSIFSLNVGCTGIRDTDFLPLALKFPLVESDLIIQPALTSLKFTKPVEQSI